jgi:hypothetical protein
MMQEQSYQQILATDLGHHGGNHRGSGGGYYEHQDDVFDDHDARWIDTVVSCAQTINKLFTRHTCRLCHVYSDRQVEYENSLSLAAAAAPTTVDYAGSGMYPQLVEQEQHQLAVISPVERAYLKTTRTANAALLQPEVEFYRQFLFDEESVVDAVYSRTGEDVDA